IAIALDAEKLRALTRPLAPRAYSIASSRREVGDEAHLLVSAVRYDSHGRARKGVASNYVAERLKGGQHVRGKLRPHRHFALPAPDQDIIMVGPGTGVAPFRAFVQERRATTASGRSWLFFGDRTFTHDFLYQLDWQDALKDGALTRMDVAFSRDTPEKMYVQHKLWQRRADLIEWLDGGAYFYLCGDAKAMAKDVRAALVRAYADVKSLTPEAAEQAVVTLEREKRYRADTYGSCTYWATNDRRIVAQRAHQGSERLSARHAGRRPARGNHRRDHRGRGAAGEIPRHVFAGRPRPASRAHPQEDGEGLRLHDPGAHPGRGADAAAVAHAGRGRPRLRQRHDADDDATDGAAARRHQVEPEGNAEIDRYRSAQLDCGLRRHQPQRPVQRAAGAVGRACGGDRAGAVDLGSSAAAYAGLSRDLARRRADCGRRGGGGRADLWQDLPAAQLPGPSGGV